MKALGVLSNHSKRHTLTLVKLLTHLPSNSDKMDERVSKLEKEV